MKYHNIYVVYTKEAETADQYIEKTTHEIIEQDEITESLRSTEKQIRNARDGKSDLER